MSAPVDLNYQAEMLAAKTKHYLITMMGRAVEEASPDELYRAISYALREEIMIHWLANVQTHQEKDVRKIYYLSMEYLPGKIFTNNMISLGSQEIVRLALEKMNRSFQEIIARELDPGLGNGGLGRLASCLLDSLATLNYPAIGYGLRYQYGIFEQQLWNGKQIEAPDCWLLAKNPWEFRNDLRKTTVKYNGTTSLSKNIHGDEILNLHHCDEVWSMPYDIPIVGYPQKELPFSVGTLRLWSTKESPRNFKMQRFNAGVMDEAGENTALTDVLYPNDNHEVGKRIRLKQEFLLVSSSLQDIVSLYLAKHQNFRAFADKVRIQINDTHPSLVIPELIRILTKHHDIPWQMAVDITKECTGYTNHTILSEALETWDQELMLHLLPRQYKIIERLNYEFCSFIRTKYPGNEDKVQRLSILQNEKVKMAHLAIIGSHKVNGVAAIHTEILTKEVFKEFFELYPDRFVNITNGVTQRHWLLLVNPELAKLITKKIGDSWITHFEDLRKLEAFAKDIEVQEEFLAIKKKNKLSFIEYIRINGKIRDDKGEYTLASPILDHTALFDVQIKRIHEYKRQLLNAFYIIMLYQDLLENGVHDKIKRVSIFAGKAAAGYKIAKDIIRLIYCIGRKINKDPKTESHLKLIYVENYNVSKAEMIIPAADLSEQISTAGTEASGTSNMKLSMNGALTIGTRDGANIEMEEEVKEGYFPFTFGLNKEEVSALKNSNAYNPYDIYNNNPKIKKALDTLQDRTFAENEEEHQAFKAIFDSILQKSYNGPGDKYFILKDIESYIETQKKVDALYQQPHLWAEYCLYNIAGMGKFSTDVSIENYSTLIWNLEKTPIDPAILERIEDEYKTYDQCRIY